MADPSHTRAAGTEAWLVRPGDEAELAACRAAFETHLPATVLAFPEPACQRWAAAFAGGGACGRLQPGPAGDVAAALVDALTRAEGRLFAFLPGPALCATVAGLLGLAPPGARALRVDPGRAFLLRDERVGLVLRHANVLGPEHDPGTRLPLWRGAP